MHRFIPFLALLSLAGHAAEDVTNTTPLVLDRLVVRDRLDKAREDIVPSLGASEFQLDRAQLDTLALGTNAGFNEVLLRVPGVAQDSFGQVHLRGEHGDLQYRINDVLLPEGLTGFGQELDTRFVERVAIVTGALPAQYGYRTSGIVDIHTRDARRTGGELTVYGGSFGTARANAEVTAAGAKVSAYVTATAERSDLGVENPTPERTAIHDRKTQQRAFAYVSGEIDGTSRLSVMVSGSFARFQIPNNPGQQPAYSLRGAPAISSAQLDENQREENHYGIVAYQKSIGTFSAQVSGFTRYSLVAFEPDRRGDLIFNGTASHVHRALVGNGLEFDSKWEAHEAHTLRAGALVASTNAGTKTTTAVFPTDGDGEPTSDVPLTIRDDQRKLGWLGGVYVQDEWKVSNAVTLNAGARADTSRAFRNESQLSPRVNLVFKPMEKLGFHAGYARYFTPPPVELVRGASLGKFAGTTNEPELKASSPVRSERAHYVDAGFSAAVTPDVSVSVDAYHKRTADVLDEGQFGQALIFSPFNYRRGKISGVEVSASFTRARFTAYTNVGLSRATAREIVSGEFQFDAEEMAYIARHDVPTDHDQRVTSSAGASYRAGRTTIYADMLHGSGLRRGFANSERLPAYVTANVGIEHRVPLGGVRELRLRIDVINVGDKVYALRDGSGIGVGAPQYGMRRAVFGGATLAF